MQTFNVDGLSKIMKPSIEALIHEMDKIFLAGLVRKGFIFENEGLLKKFVSENCRCEDRPSLGTRTYYANEKPFLVHHYLGESYNKISNKWIVTLSSFRFID